MVIGDIQLTGYWGSDTIEIVTDSGDSLILDDYQFFLITHIDGTDEKDLEGIIGLGLPQTENPDWPSTSIFQTLYDNEMIINPEYSIYACKIYDCQPSITLGGNNSDYIKLDQEPVYNSAYQIEGFE